MIDSRFIMKSFYMTQRVIITINTFDMKNEADQDSSDE
jgi:hypothetical protein